MECNIFNVHNIMQFIPKVHIVMEMKLNLIPHPLRSTGFASLLRYPLEGAGGSSTENIFLYYCCRWQAELPDAFYWIKKY